ncbi:hypothetical protein Patl1_27591 [Pistacia atlantica]|uniref:Uncharacterized protein n=1 Tax=Pistacia atlantica TaxID=434234 RepID=A0ACC1BD56_9ROSI|nr:hypothetical protein Patl1_27591 [Pistacia atlantica]
MQLLGISNHFEERRKRGRERRCW